LAHSQLVARVVGQERMFVNHQEESHRVVSQLEERLSRQEREAADMAARLAGANNELARLQAVANSAHCEYADVRNDMQNQINASRTQMTKDLVSSEQRLEESYKRLHREGVHLLRSELSLKNSFFKSKIVRDLPPILEEFRTKRFTLLWRGTRDGLTGEEFHRRCDRHANTLTLVLSTDGDIFGGFTPITWEPAYPLPPAVEEGMHYFKPDWHRKSFIFTLKNQCGIAPRRFALTNVNHAIWCCSGFGPVFGADLLVAFDLLTKDSKTFFCPFAYENDAIIDKPRLFLRPENYTVKEIEVFELAE
jgi:hypothetical protein